jgi:hypothetical protein
LEEVIEELKALAATCAAFEPKKLTNPNNKWFVRSGLQKSIRRGETEPALRCGEYLYAEETAYAWKALSTIIVEDVGFGDLDLLAWSTVTTLLGVVKQTAAPSRLFGAMIQRACSSVKTRSACELSLGADKDPAVSWKEIRASSTDQLLEQLDISSWPEHYARAVVLRERARKDGNLLHNLLERIMADVEQFPRKRAAMMSFERTVDTMNLAIWPLLDAKYDLDELIVQPDVMPPEIRIAGVTGAALDMHVADGKRAIKAFHTSLCKTGNAVMLDLGKRTKEVVKALGAIIFILEGGQIDKRLMSKRLADLKMYQDRNFAIAYGVPEDLFWPLLKLVDAEFDRLNSKRSWAFNNH